MHDVPQKPVLKPNRSDIGNYHSQEDTKVGSETGRVGPLSFGINYGSISFGQLSGYIVFCTVPILGAKPPL